MTNVSDEEWQKYKEQFNKNYADDEEDLKRRDLYAKSKMYVENHNQKYETGEVTYQMGINQFSDMTQEEKSTKRGCRPQN